MRYGNGGNDDSIPPAGDDGYRGVWWHEAQRLNSLVAHHAGNRAMADLDAEQQRKRAEDCEARYVALTTRIHRALIGLPDDDD